MNAPQEPKDLRAMTADSVGKDLLSALVTELKLMPKTWPQLSETKQNDIIDRLRARVDGNIKMAVHLLAAQGRTVVAGDLDQITIKGGVKAVVKFGTGAANLHELYEVAGKSVLVVVANPGDHTGGMDDVTGEADQRAMDLGHEYNEDDGGGMDGGEGAVVDAEFLAVEHQPLEADLDAAFDAGYEAAADGKPQSECPTMDGALCIAWVKGWKHWHELHGEGAADDEAKSDDKGED